MNIKKSRIFLAFICIVLVAGLIPFPTEGIPEWKVTAVDKQGKALPGIELIEEWRFSNTLSMSREARLTDQNGEVTFPARTFISPLLVRVGLLGFDWLNFIVGHGSPMGAYAVVGSKNTSHLIQFIDGEKQNTITIVKL